MSRLAPLPLLVFSHLCVFPLLYGCQEYKGNEKAVTGQTAESADIAAAEAQRRLASRDFSGAVPPLRDLARLRPDAPDVFEMLGVCVRRSSDRDKFLAEARKDLERDPKDTAALTIAANALVGPDNQGERIALMRRLVELRPQDPSLRLTLAQELVNAHLYAEARPHLDHLLKRLSESESPDEQGIAAALPYYLRGKTLYYGATNAAGLSSAEADLEEAVRHDPKLGWPYLYLARIDLARNAPDAAIGRLKEARERMPENPEVLFELARAYRAKGDKEQSAKAEAAFRQRRELELRCISLVTRCGAFPNDFDLHLQAATALMEKGDLEQALAFSRRTLTLRPDDTRARALARRIEERLRSGEPR